MKLAIISDIHANLPALNAVMEDIRNQNVDGIYCLGDLVNFAGWDNEVISLIRSHNIPCVQGNHDEGIGCNMESFPFSFSNKAKEDADVLLMGHTHKPFHRKLRCENTETQKVYRHAVNVGSVGKSKHSDNRACYVMMEINENTTLENPESFHIKFHFINYDVEKVIRKIKEIGLSDAFDEFLKKGYGHEKNI